MEDPQGIRETESAQNLALRLDLPFSDILLLNRALTHRSFHNEHPEAVEDNERLEFLGDAVLDFLVGAWLYNHFPEMSEGELTRMRSALVRTDTLADFARQIELGNALRLGRGEDDGGGRTRSAILCGTFEALIGALYLEAGMLAVRTFIEPLIDAAAVRVLADHNDSDPKSRFQEWAQSEGLGTPEYQTVSSHGPDHDKVFEVEAVIDHQIYGRGEGRSKQSAAKAAASHTLKLLDLE